MNKHSFLAQTRNFSTSTEHIDDLCGSKEEMVTIVTHMLALAQLGYQPKKGKTPVDCG
jgi:hypothetical protein